MSKTSDSVSVAFELMLSEIESEIDALNVRGSECFHGSQYDEAERLVAFGKKLKAFSETVQNLHGKWVSEFSSLFPAEVIPDAVVKARRVIASSQKASKTRLLIVFADGSSIFEPSAAKSLAQFIKRIGFERVRNLNYTVNGEPLVSNQKSSIYNDTEIDGFFVKTHSNTNAKCSLIQKISLALGMKIEVKIVG